MKKFLRRVRAFLFSEDGPAGTEYAIMIALIIIVSLAAITGLGTKIVSVFTTVDNGMAAGASS